MRMDEHRDASPKLPARLVAPVLLSVLLASGCGFDPAFHRPNVIAASPDGSFLVVNDSQARRLLVLDSSFRLVREIRHPHFSSIWGVLVTDQEIIVTNSRTTGVGKTHEERVALTVNEFLAFDHQGVLRRSQSWSGRESPLRSPGSFVQAKDGSFLVADYRQNCLLRFNSQFGLIERIATQGSDPGFLHHPSDIEWTRDGHLIVVDQYNSRLQVFGADGSFMRVVSSLGEELGQLNFPQYLAVDDDGSIYVTELGTMRVSVFDHEFRFVRALFPPRRQDTDIFQLFGIALLRDPKRVVVVDSINNRLYVFDAQGKHVDTVERVRCPN